MTFITEMLTKKIKYLSRFKILKIRANLLVIFSVYSVLLLLTLLLFGYSSLANIDGDEKQGKLAETSQKVRIVASEIRNENDIGAIEKEIKESGMLDKGSFVLLNENGNKVYSTDKRYSEPQNAEAFMKKLDNTFGMIESNAFGHGDEYIFYEKLEDSGFILIYTAAVDFLGEYHFHKLSVLLFSGLLYLFICFIIIRRFRNKIYYPIVNVEKVIHGIVKGDMDFGINGQKEDDVLYPLYSDLNIMIERLKDLISREYNANVMKKQAELDALQSQINPHFLYNTLESIRGQAISNGMDDIEIMTKALSDLFRYSISKKGNLVTLEEELKNIDNYLMIQQYRFNNKFIIVSEVEPDTLHYKIPKLLIQPIVENAIHHGLETKAGKGTLTIKAYITTKRLVVNIRDNGIGISHDKLVDMNEALVNSQGHIDTKASGFRIGLINVNERIKLNFGSNYGLRIYSAEQVGTNVEIVLPLIND